MTSHYNETFQAGLCCYRVETIQAIPQVFLQPDQWKDGFYAFSHREIRKKAFDPAMVAGLDLFRERCRLDKSPAYLMEIGLWRQSHTSGEQLDSDRDTFFEEISLERDDQTFFLQTWTLYPHEHSSHFGSQTVEPGASPHKTASLSHGCDGLFPCRYRPVPTLPSPNSLFQNRDLYSMEIIVPQLCCHFFLTTGEV